MSNRCPVCNKFAYAAESCNINGTFYHKSCMKCKVCNCNLSISSYKLLKGTNEIYCSVHLPQPKNLQAATTLETMTAKQCHRPELVNKNIQGGVEQRRNLQATDTLDIQSAQRTKGVLVNSQVRGCCEQRTNTGKLGIADVNAIAQSKSSQSLVNGQVHGGSDQRTNTGKLGIADVNAIAQSKSSQSLYNAQVRGAGRNCQATESIEIDHIKQAPKVGVIQNPQIRGTK
ncbi:hypothetical protein ENUP19_0062G0016 [Entamoeba nuttalli]|uniref:LIM zinc finger domain containing protein n=2 Tax=Entamoeba nuttalli TaxID=412467 RepID=K2GSQ2_ENTNP|nr:LIM zinc finger domain containing protein [Entamoeba nuttalli P19]EKE38023.1 LIM zinc finger domain containing protein [Entamoeba nuttalli P19]|eukprot:XP_008859628.1 LIM zinc finger domain containing protein [Entamoeba nuttalli P19]